MNNIKKNVFSPLITRSCNNSNKNLLQKKDQQNFHKQNTYQRKESKVNPRTSIKNRNKTIITSSEIEELNLYPKRSYLERYEKLRQYKQNEKIEKNRKKLSVSANTTKRGLKELIKKEKVHFFQKKPQSMINSPIMKKKLLFSPSKSEMFNNIPQSKLKEYEMKTPNKYIINGKNNIPLGNENKTAPRKDLTAYLFNNNNIIINNNNNHNNSSESISFGNSTSNNSKYLKFININTSFEIVQCNQLEIMNTKPKTEIKETQSTSNILSKITPIDIKGIPKSVFSQQFPNSKDLNLSVDNNSSRHIKPIKRSEQCNFIHQNQVCTYSLPSQMYTEQEVDINTFPHLKTNESGEDCQFMKVRAVGQPVTLACHDIIEDSFEESGSSTKTIINKVNANDEIILNDLNSNICSQLELIKSYPKFPLNICKIFIHMNKQNINYVKHLVERTNRAQDVIMEYRYNIILKNYNMLDIITNDYLDKSNNQSNKSRNNPVIDLQMLINILNENMKIINEIMSEGVNIIKGK